MLFRSLPPLILTNTGEERSTGHFTYEESNCFKEVKPLVHSHGQETAEPGSELRSHYKICCVNQIAILSLCECHKIFFFPQPLDCFHSQQRELSQELIGGSNF